MGTAIAKDDTGVLGVARSNAYLLDCLADQMTFRVNITDEMLGALVRGKSSHLIVSVVGEDIRAALGQVTA